MFIITNNIILFAFVYFFYLFYKNKNKIVVQGNIYVQRKIFVLKMFRKIFVLKMFRKIFVLKMFRKIFIFHQNVITSFASENVFIFIKPS